MMTENSAKASVALQLASRSIKHQLHQKTSKSYSRSLIDFQLTAIVKYHNTSDEQSAMHTKRVILLCDISANICMG